MEAKNDKVSETQKLRAAISIVAESEPVSQRGVLDTNPVLLQGMNLPAEASYEFSNPTFGRPYVNLPSSIELFFGDNGQKGADVSLGKFQLRGIISPAFAGSEKIEIKLTVSAGESLSIAVLDYPTPRFRSIGFVDISKLEPPDIKTKPASSSTSPFSLFFPPLSNLFPTPKPRETGMPRRGKDISQKLIISFEEALYGSKKEVEIASTETCPVCNGSGVEPGKTMVHCTDCQGIGWKIETKPTAENPSWSGEFCHTCQGDGLINENPCHDCRGNGWVPTTRSIMLQIPMGIDSGAEFCFPHQGEPGRYGGLSGHLRIAISVAPHPLFDRTGDDISIRLPVSIGFAKEGGYLRVPDVTKGNFFLVKLPAGVKSDTTFQVFENKDYTLTAQIETYRPAFLFALPNIRKRLQAIEAALGNADYEIPAHLNHVTVDQISTSVELSQAEKLRGTMTQHSPVGVAPVVERSPNDAEFYTLRGIVYAKRGNRERALADYNKALKLDPNYASAYDNRSIVYVFQNELGKAIADLNKAIELDPNNAEYYWQRGMSYHLQNDLAMALADYNKALELDPFNAHIYESRGKLFTLQNDLEAALSDFSKVLELDPNDAGCYFRRGELYQYMHDLANALADFDKALELDPNNSFVLSERGQVYMLKDDLEKALADMHTVVERNPSDARAYNNRGYIYFLRNNLAEALADYNKALELDPKLLAAYNGRGKVHLKQTHYRQAVDDFDKSLALQPGKLYLYQWLGQAYQGLGEKDKAITLYQKVLENDPSPELREETQTLLDNLSG